jgi:hypothetical protein
MKTKTKKPTGYLLHEGFTRTGHEFVAIATLKTDNRKTGDMAQIWFLLKHENPVVAVKEGLDAATICDGCPFASGNGCYVNVGHAPLGIWRAYHRGSYPAAYPADYARIFGGRKVRFGAYGNPSLLPVSIVKAIASVSTGWTGYFHDWRTNAFASEYAKFFMTSTETEASRLEAKMLGFRYFHVSPVKPDDAIECLSDAKGISCAQCKLCAGLTKKRQPSVWINPHGTYSKKASQAAMA